MLSFGFNIPFIVDLIWLAVALLGFDMPLVVALIGFYMPLVVALLGFYMPLVVALLCFYIPLVVALLVFTFIPLQLVVALLWFLHFFGLVFFGCSSSSTATPCCANLL